MGRSVASPVSWGTFVRSVACWFVASSPMSDPPSTVVSPRVMRSAIDVHRRSMSRRAARSREVTSKATMCRCSCCAVVTPAWWAPRKGTVPSGSGVVARPAAAATTSSVRPVAARIPPPTAAVPRTPTPMPARKRRRGTPGAGVGAVPVPVAAVAGEPAVAAVVRPSSGGRCCEVVASMSSVMRRDPFRLRCVQVCAGVRRCVRVCAGVCGWGGHRVPGGTPVPGPGSRGCPGCGRAGPYWATTSWTFVTRSLSASRAVLSSLRCGSVTVS